jgi:hypothetical protein
MNRLYNWNLWIDWNLMEPSVRRFHKFQVFQTFQSENEVLCQLSIR